MSNRLGKETSPYLLQHADNPVDWYPWSEEAFAAARAGNKPVLLSIGYSACHWCHVMAHESFEDQATAELMNQLFVNIKVDREERPDIDRIYQTAHQLLTQRGGGWPLTMFLNANDQRPFFGGTYFPKERRYGMPAFSELLQHIAAYYADNADDVRSQGDRLSEVFARLDPPAADAALSISAGPMDKVRAQLAKSFDADYGGFGPAPKFPHPGTIERLLRHWRSTAKHEQPDIEALFMATLTLTRMAEGGIYDHVGGGFCRYSVDRYWQIPHFEKMLYDNGPLLAIYAQAFLATGETLFANTAAETADWMLADMRAPNGGFYSSRDADSEGHEGRFFVWTPERVAGVVARDDYEVVAARFGLDKEANFEGEWHLTVRQSVPHIAAASQRSQQAVAAALARARAALFADRETRVHPGRDDKQLTSWNALAIRGLAIAGRILQRDHLVEAAASALDFLHQQLLVDGRLYASYKDGRARFPAYLDDHAFLVDAILELLQSRWNTGQLRFATQVADLMLEHFEDPENGGFYFTADDHEALMHRPKPLADEAMPSGNGVAAYALQRLGHLLGEERYIAAAERGLRAAWQAIDEYPHGHVTLLNALEEYLAPPEIIVLRGAAADIGRWRDSAGRLYAPTRLVFAIDEEETDLPGLLRERKPVAGEAVAYRCLGTHCELPVTSWEALAAQL
ncbi:MAG: thioredoxin domain-containing protein [Gammaproteobacteria bacterium]|nr:thioredoxin domain-containing protein [Gammaproteobacteria bacterium]MDH5302796.1 thioredoxin domain-containing protein [Gammaproteobacteria bacterium]MDH5322356.1 thioredoxin domain-containing protein [Gammaproteobacteria bacterium]